eukprot:m.192246 g.192246  ORF g.192246 m.192246 type:complete len:93 (-) comp13651_c1_seq3:2506-2784(-)
MLQLLIAVLELSLAAHVLVPSYFPPSQFYSFQSLPIAPSVALFLSPGLSVFASENDIKYNKQMSAATTLYFLLFLISPVCPSLRSYPDCAGE